MICAFRDVYVHVNNIYHIIRKLQIVTTVRKHMYNMSSYYSPIGLYSIQNDR